MEINISTAQNKGPCNYPSGMDKENMTFTLDNGITLTNTQQQLVIKEVKSMGMTEAAEMLQEGCLWDEEQLLNIVEDMENEGEL